MPETAPAKLYWYRSLADDRKEWAQETIVDSKIYLAAPQAYNDPFEFRFRLSFDAPRKQKIEYFKSKLIRNKGLDESEAEREAQRAVDPGLLTDREFEAHKEKTLGITFVEHFRTSTGVLSLTETDSHPLMWAHYADAHRGICLEFDTTVEPGRNPLAAALRAAVAGQRPEVVAAFLAEQIKADPGGRLRTG
ncbi:MAG: DUF2971 domain-containing protein [Gemmatimonadetes bacterium]|nr:DUF2971 domain-containing protein [Gemmatimonadota bacterium]